MWIIIWFHTLNLCGFLTLFWHSMFFTCNGFWFKLLISFHVIFMNHLHSYLLFSTWLFSNGLFSWFIHLFSHSFLHTIYFHMWSHDLSFFMYDLFHMMRIFTCDLYFKWLIYHHLYSMCFHFQDAILLPISHTLHMMLCVYLSSHERFQGMPCWKALSDAFETYDHT